MNTRMTFLALAVTAVLAGASLAQDPTMEAVSGTPTWNFQISPYLWGPSVDGNVGVGPLTMPVEIELADILDNMEGVLMLYAGGQWGRWSLGIEGMYFKLGGEPSPTDLNIGNAELDFEQILIDAQTAYTIYDRPNLKADIIVGIKYNHFEIGLKSTPNPEGIAATSAALTDAIGRQVQGAAPSPTPPGGLPPRLVEAIKTIMERFGPGVVDEVLNQVQGAASAQVNSAISSALTSAATQDIKHTEDWIDPYVGARVLWDFHKRWYAVGRGDIGGFGVGADLTWQVYGGAGYRLADYATVELGYRHLDFDYSNDQLAMDLAYSGPMLGARFTF